MLPLKNAALSALLLFALAGCVTATNGQTSTPSSGGGKKNTVLFKVSGRDITAQEFVTSPGLRQSIRQFLLTEAIKADCAKRGISVDEAEVEQKLNEQKQQAEMQSRSWDEYLEQSMMTENEYREAIKLQLFFDELIAARVDVSEEELKQNWEVDKDTIISAYIMENHLPDSDRDKITYEQSKEFNRKRIIAQKGPIAQEDMFKDLVNSMQLDLSPLIPDKERAKTLEDLILNNAKTEQEEEPAEKEGVVLNGGEEGKVAGAGGAEGETAGGDTDTTEGSGADDSASSGGSAAGSAQGGR